MPATDQAPSPSDVVVTGAVEWPWESLTVTEISSYGAPEPAAVSLSSFSAVMSGAVVIATGGGGATSW